MFIVLPVTTAFIVLPVRRNYLHRSTFRQKFERFQLVARSDLLSKTPSTCRRSVDTPSTCRSRHVGRTFRRVEGFFLRVVEGPFGSTRLLHVDGDSYPVKL